jgi:putative hydrolase of the HAD superfamily
MASGNNHGDTKSLPVRAVILDYGEVLCFQPAPEALGRMAKTFGIAPERFLERYIPTRGPYDQGLLTAEEYWVNFARDAGVGIDTAQIETLRTWDTGMWSRINGEMIDWLEKVHAAGLTTALLSNMQHDMAAHARKNFAWLAHFDHQIFSCEVRLIKPDTAIFQRTVERIGVRPQEALFVDDREANIEAARQVGLNTVRFESVGQLREDLKEIGFPIMPGDGAERGPTAQEDVAQKTSGLTALGTTEPAPCELGCRDGAQHSFGSPQDKAAPLHGEANLNEAGRYGQVLPR